MTFPYISRDSPVPNLSIRQICHQECKLLNNLEIECFGGSWFAAPLSNSKADSKITVYALFEDRLPVSYLMATVLMPEIEILRIGTAAAHRRRGYAIKLMKLAIEQWKQQGALSVWLEVRESNTSAQRMYSELGFEENRRRKGYYTRQEKHLEREDFASGACDQCRASREDAVELALWIS